MLDSFKLSHYVAFGLLILFVGRTPLLFWEPAELGFSPQAPMEHSTDPVVFRPGAKGMATGGWVLHLPSACACACVCDALCSLSCA